MPRTAMEGSTRGAACPGVPTFVTPRAVNPGADARAAADQSAAWTLRDLSVAAFAVVLAFALGVPPGHAAHRLKPNQEKYKHDGPKFDIDRPPPTRYHITPALTYDAYVELEFEYEKNYDLDNSVDEDLATLQPLISLVASYDPNEHLRALVKLEGSRDFRLEQPAGKKRPPTELNVERAYITAREVLPGLSVQLGRQRFDDDREWIYDEDLDGARLFYRVGRFGLELSASREKLVRKDLLNKDKRKRINNYMAMGRVTIGKKSEAGAYVFARDDRDARPEDLQFFGIQMQGRITSVLEYWADAAHVRGTRTSSTKTRDIRGFGFDLGVTYLSDHSLQPSVTLGVAFGSGDANSSDDTDRNYRQSGLQDNNGKFNGVTSFRYYGETFDPELSNMVIATVGLGLRPTKRSSIDLVYHYYQQHHPDDDLRDSNLDLDPNGIDTSLGHGLDLVVGYHEVTDLDLNLVLGGFFPGAAFGPDADNAYFAGVEIQYKI